MRRRGGCRIRMISMIIANDEYGCSVALSVTRQRVEYQYLVGVYWYVYTFRFDEMYFITEGI